MTVAIFSRKPEGDLTRWQYDSDDYEDAIAAVKEEGGHRGPVLALIEGGAPQIIVIPDLPQPTT